MAAAKVSSAQLMKRTKGASEVEERHHYNKIKKIKTKLEEKKDRVTSTQ